MIIKKEHIIIFEKREFRSENCKTKSRILTRNLISSTKYYDDTGYILFLDDGASLNSFLTHS